MGDWRVLRCPWNVCACWVSPEWRDLWLNRWTDGTWGHTRWIESHEGRATKDHSVLFPEWVLIWEARNLVDQSICWHHKISNLLVEDSFTKPFLDIPHVPLAVWILPGVMMHGENSLATSCTASYPVLAGEADDEGRPDRSPVGGAACCLQRGWMNNGKAWPVMSAIMLD